MIAQMLSIVNETIAFLGDIHRVKVFFT